MKTYSVKVSAEAKAVLDNILGYLKYEKKNHQAVRNVYKDYVETRKALATTADSQKTQIARSLLKEGLSALSSGGMTISCFSGLMETRQSSPTYFIIWKTSRIN